MIDPIEAMKWNSIRHFKANEFGIGWEKLDFDVVVLIDRLRDYIKCPIKINCAWAKDGHSKKSQHYIGRAIDCVAKDISLLDFYLAADAVGFTGIGAYPFWNTPGLHVDIRDGDPIRWYQNEDGEYVYGADKVIDVLERLEG